MTQHTLPITLKLTGKEGLAPHVAAQFAMTASHFEGLVTVSCHGHKANAKSVTEVMSLGAQHNDLIELYAEGEHAQQAVNALIVVIQNHQ